MISKEFTYRVIGDKRDVEKIYYMYFRGALVFNLSGCDNTSDKTSSESKETNSKQEEKKVQTTDEAKTKENTKQKNTEQTKENSKIKRKRVCCKQGFSYT